MSVESYESRDLDASKSICEFLSVLWQCSRESGLRAIDRAQKNDAQKMITNFVDTK